MRPNQFVPIDLIPEDKEEVGLGVLVEEMAVTVTCVTWSGVVVVEGLMAVWVIDGGNDVDWATDEVDVEMGVETKDATEESGRLGFCPGNVSTGSCIPAAAQLS